MGKSFIACFIVITVFSCFETVALNKKANSKDWEDHRKNVLMGDLPGAYCGRRPGGCCPGRVDDCTVPILDTTCYCDIFCNETSLDCCPDFWSFCLGIEPPTPLINSCEYDGAIYPEGYKRRENCNECICIKTAHTATGYMWRCTQNVCLVRPELIQRVNDGKRGWIASNYSAFWGKTLEEGKRYRLGTMPPENQVIRMNSMDIHMDGYLPEAFDARKKWNGLIHTVEDQGDCAASWAFSTTGMASDRLAIESGGVILDSLSPQHLISCNTAGGQAGCSGGYLDRAWWYLRKRGLVTDDCYSYNNGKDHNASSCAIIESRGTMLCPNGFKQGENKLFRSTPPYRIAPDEHQIMKEIVMNGPVQATFKVKDDFFLYQSGVYRYLHLEEDHMPDGDVLGYHSVRILGWGVQREPTGESVKYWLCANSWGPEWGDSGYFRIIRGENECQIESFVIGVWGRAPGDVTVRRMINSKKRQQLRYRLNRLRQQREKLRYAH